MNTFKLISLPTPFDFSFALDYLDRSPLECMHSVKNNSVTKLFNLGGCDYIINVSIHGTNQLKINILWTNAKSIGWPEIIKYVEVWFDLNTDLAEVYTVFNKSKILKPLVTNFNGLRIIGISDLFEVICWAIIGQQINLTFAYQVKRNFVIRHGRKLDFNGESYYLFPSPESSLKISSEEWKEMKFSRQKARYIRLLAEKMISGDFSKPKLNQLDSSAIKSELLKLVGIGEWSADYVLMRCFHVGSAFPRADAGLHQALKAVLSLNRKPNNEELEKMSIEWHPWQAYATFYLWRTLH